MSAFDLNQASVDPFDQENHDDDRERDNLPVHNSTNSFSCPGLFDAALHHQSPDYRMSYQFHQLQKEPKELLFIPPGSGDLAIPHAADSIKLSLYDPYAAAEDDQAAERAGKYWMSSKMRLMRKMMNSTTQIIVSKSMESMAASGDRGCNANDNRSSDGSISPAGSVVRVCSDCKTTKTPLWRSGPRGPKSLCNACGIRQRKARRALAAAAALGGGAIPAAAAPMKVRKEKKLDIDRTLPFKKRCKIMDYTAPTMTTNTSTTTTAAAAAAVVAKKKKKLGFEDQLTLSSTKSSAAPAMQKAAFPEDERDAAVLLMALSCGLIRS